jgi:hypothetical protein
MVRRLASLLTLILAAAHLTLAQTAADVTGAWLVMLPVPQGGTTLEVTLKQDGEAVTGTIASPMGTVNVTGTMVAGALSIKYSLPLQGTPLDLTMTGKLTAADGGAAENMTGVVSIGGLGELPWTARRKPPASALAVAPPPAPAAAPDPATAGTAAGKWNIVLKAGQGEFPMAADLEQQGEQVTGTVILAAVPGSALKVHGTMRNTTLSLTFAVPTPQGEMNGTIAGELGAAGFAGKATLGPLGDADWTGTRVP